MYPSILGKLGERPKVVFRRGKNLKVLLEHKDTFTTCNPGMFKCHNCNYCRYVQETNCFHINGRLYKLNHRFNCNSSFIIYLAKCTLCLAFYKGKTERRLGGRVYEHLYAIRKCKLENALAKHNSGYQNHNFNLLAIDQVNTDCRGGPRPLKLEELELVWQVRLNAYSHPGLNDTCSISSVLKLNSLKRWILSFLYDTCLANYGDSSNFVPFWAILYLVLNLCLINMCSEVSTWLG